MLLRLFTDTTQITHFSFIVHSWPTYFNTWHIKKHHMITHRAPKTWINASEMIIYNVSPNGWPAPEIMASETPWWYIFVLQLTKVYISLYNRSNTMNNQCSQNSGMTYIGIYWFKGNFMHVSQCMVFHASKIYTQNEFP